MRPAATGLATAFFRLYLLDTLVAGPQRPAAILATVAAERLPLANGAFGRALQSLLEGGHLAPAQQGAVALTPLGAAERVAERERWTAVVPTVLRLLGDLAVRAEPAATVAEDPPPDYRAAQAAEAYLDRVLITAVRERLAIARDGGTPFALALARLDLAHPQTAARRAMLHRAMRATLGGASGLLGGDTDAYRWGEAGVAVLAPLGGDPARGERIAALLELRLDELARTMTASVRAFHGARWRVRSAGLAWTPELPSSGALLRAAADALDRETTSLETAVA
ncbi:MAG: hypothetical protein Q7S25_01490 [Candidatus Limnocylindria bacterium]|nr:hypothetical protein [Candidatus Limnocylindria bacterium]